MLAIEEQLKQAKIMIVDDMPENLQVLGSTLTQKGFKVSFATSGYQAVSSALVKVPDLILLDIQMPDMDGYETCRVLKNDLKTKDIPIIFLTGKNDTNDVIAGFEAGAVDYIIKPFNQLELLARVATQLRIKFLSDYISKQNVKLTLSNTQYVKDNEKISELNKKLQHSENRLINEAKVRKALLLVMAENLRQPISMMQQSLKMLTDDYDSIRQSEIKNMLAYNYKLSGELYEVFSNLMVWIKSTTHIPNLNLKKIDIKALIIAMKDINSEVFTKKNVDFENSLPDGLFACCDENLMSIIFKNVFASALRYIKQNGKISVSALNNSDSIVIRLEDNGQSEHQDEIQKFIDLANSDVMDFSNMTSIGLKICKEFALIQNGTFECMFSKQDGTIMEIFLPTAKN